MTVEELRQAIEHSVPIVVDENGPHSEAEIQASDRPDASVTRVKPQVWADLA
jgi:hypothetical protein